VSRYRNHRRGTSSQGKTRRTSMSGIDCSRTNRRCPRKLELHHHRGLSLGSRCRIQPEGSTSGLRSQHLSQHKSACLDKGFYHLLDSLELRASLYMKQRIGHSHIGAYQGDIRVNFQQLGINFSRQRRVLLHCLDTGMVSHHLRIKAVNCKTCCLTSKIRLDRQHHHSWGKLFQ
jgi:hypothetical protein